MLLLNYRPVLRQPTGIGVYADGALPACRAWSIGSSLAAAAGRRSVWRDCCGARRACRGWPARQGLR
jgi:hypothetical protein